MMPVGMTEVTKVRMMTMRMMNLTTSFVVIMRQNQNMKYEILIENTEH